MSLYRGCELYKTLCGVYKNGVSYCVKHVFPVVVECGSPPPPTFENGTRTINGVQFGTETNFSCDAGYRLRGPDRIICQADGSWSEVDPFCESKITDVAADTVCRVAATHLPLLWSFTAVG